MYLLRLLLDEHVSPKIVDPLIAEGIDALPLRDRNMLGCSDARVWQLALHEWRALVTNNARHFVTRAQATAKHPGVVVIPEGMNREEQLNYLLSLAAYALDKNAIAPSFSNCIVSIDESGVILSEEVCGDATPAKVLKFHRS